MSDPREQAVAAGLGDGTPFIVVNLHSFTVVHPG